MSDLFTDDFGDGSKELRGKEKKQLLVLFGAKRFHTLYPMATVFIIFKLYLVFITIAGFIGNWFGTILVEKGLQIIQNK